MFQESRKRKLIGVSVGLIILVKLVLMGLFSSDYQNWMFIPFVNAFLDGAKNPYETFYLFGSMSSYFPYPPVMLFVESIGAFLIRLFRVDSVFLTNLLFKLPLLIADCLTLLFLRKICAGEGKNRYLLVLYFCSPIILYSTFMHGQLDIIPTMFLVMALYLLLRGEQYDYILFSVITALAICSKLHIIAVVPLLLWYLFLKRDLKETIISGVIIVGLSAIIMAPFMSEGFINKVLLSKEQGMLTNVAVNYGSLLVYVPILIVAVLYFKVFLLNHMGSDLMLCLTGVIYAIFLCCTPAMPAWFVWIIPFIVIYFIKVEEKKHKVMAMYAVLCVVYLFYYVFLHTAGFTDLIFLDTSLEFLKINSEMLKNVTFTILIATLVTIVISMYQFGIAGNMIYKRGGLPFVLGIAGDSGAGKSELLKHLEGLFSASRILYIEGDGDHKWERGNAKWYEYTHLDPKANYLYRQAKDLEILRCGNAVSRVEYYHDTGRFSRQHRIKAKPFIIMCGLHALYLPKMRKSLDLKIYMDTDDTLRKFWKIKRDISERGYEPGNILAQIESREDDSIRFIKPQKKYADVVIKMFDMKLTDCLDVDHVEQISVMMTFPTDMELEGILEAFAEQGVVIKHEYGRDLVSQTIMVAYDQVLDKTFDFQSMAEMNIRDFNSIFSNNVVWDDGMEGIIQFFVAYAIICKMIGG